MKEFYFVHFGFSEFLTTKFYFDSYLNDHPYCEVKTRVIKEFSSYPDHEDEPFDVEECIIKTLML